MAVLAVLVTHLCLLAPHRGSWQAPVELCDHLSRFAVPLFFGLPAFLSLARPEPAAASGAALVQRLHVILPPFLAWSALYAVTPGVIAVPVPHLPLAARVALGFSEPHLYFVTAYLGLLPAVLALRALAVRPPRWLPWSLGAAAVAGLVWRLPVASWLATHPGDPPPLWADPHLPWVGLAPFACGGLLGLGLRSPRGDALRRWVRAPWGVAIATGAWLLLCLPWPHAGPDLFFARPTLDLGALLVLPALAALVTGPLGRARVLAWLGRNSLAFYLAHMLGLQTVAWLLLGRVSSGPLLALAALGGLAVGTAAIPLHRRVFLCP